MKPWFRLEKTQSVCRVINWSVHNSRTLCKMMSPIITKLNKSCTCPCRHTPSKHPNPSMVLLMDSNKWKTNLELSNMWSGLLSNLCRTGKHVNSAQTNWCRTGKRVIPRIPLWVYNQDEHRRLTKHKILTISLNDLNNHPSCDHLLSIGRRHMLRLCNEVRNT